MDVYCNGVSVMGRTWQERADPGNCHENVIDSAGRLVPPEVCRIIRGRGFGDPAAFLDSSVRSMMPDPFSLQGMREAVELFAAAVSGGRKIALYGDYDVDGATSTALVTRYLRIIGIHDSIFYIPQRLEEGYGLNSPAMDHLRAEGAELIVCLDSGTTAFAPVARARELGMDMIIIDHHLPEDRLPDAVVVNPRRSGEDGSQGHLCTAGLVMLFLAGVSRRLRESGRFSNGAEEPKLLSLMGLVAFGTVADMVPLRGLNRAYVRTGVPRLMEIPGIRALVEVGGEMDRADAQAAGRRFKPRPVDARACGWSLGPCINAAGRISDTMMGTRLLIEDDPAAARVMALELHQLNRSRRALEQTVRDEAFAQADALGRPGKAMVLYNENWHPGVVGLVANKIKDRFDCQAVVMGQGGKGSGRALEGFSIGEAFHKAVAAGLLLKGGGHAAAGGVTMPPAGLEAFRSFMEDSAKDYVHPPVKVDLRVEVGGLKVAVAEAFQLLEPCGMENEEPTVAFTGGVLRDVHTLNDAYIKGRLVSADYSVKIFFRGVGTKLGNALLGAEGRYVDLMGKVSVDAYGNTPTVQVKPTDAMIGAVAQVIKRAA